MRSLHTYIPLILGIFLLFGLKFFFSQINNVPFHNDTAQVTPTLQQSITRITTQPTPFENGIFPPLESKPTQLILNKKGYFEGEIKVVFKPNSYKQTVAFMNKNKLKFRSIVTADGIVPTVSAEKELQTAVIVPRGEEQTWVNMFSNLSIVSKASLSYENTLR